MNRQRVKPALVLVVLGLLLASACGARVTEEQISAAGSSAGGGGVGLDAGDGAESEGAGAVGAETGGASAGDTAGSAAGVGATSRTAGQAAAPGAPAGGNGGATDVGVTADTMVLGNVSTLSGPVPGLFQGAVLGTQAAIAYQNSKGGLFGRKFKLDARDDQFDTNQNRNHTKDLINKAFALVGSFSLFDDAAINEIVSAGVPDLTQTLSPARQRIPNNFSVQPFQGGVFDGGFRYFKTKTPDAVTAVGSIWANIPSAKAQWDDSKAGAEKSGWVFKYDRGIGATETDFTSDVVRMRNDGVKMVFLLAVDEKTVARLAKNMKQQNFNVPLVVQGPAYHPGLIAMGGDSVEGLINVQGFSLYAGEDSGAVPEVKLFNESLQKIRPGYKPDLFAAYGWAETRLFFAALEAAGPKAKRADVVAKLKAIDKFSSYGLLAESGPGTKRPATCYVMSKITGGKWARFDSPADGSYRCDSNYVKR